MNRHHQKIVPIKTAYRHYRRPYPNAAEPQYYLDRLVDSALAVATGMGCITILFFLVTL